jgi:hypothetical protein
MTTVTRDQPLSPEDREAARLQIGELRWQIVDQLELLDAFASLLGLLPATFDDHEGVTIHEHELMNMVSPS